jgi:hypothetical protein
MEEIGKLAQESRLSAYPVQALGNWKKIKEA